MFRNLFMKTGFFMDADGGGGSGAGGAGDGAGKGEGEGENKNTPETKSYTQAQLDQMFGERSTRAEKVAIEKMMTELGVKDKDELKAILEENKKRKEGEMSDLDKEKAARLDAEGKAKDALTAAETIKAAATTRLMKAEVKAEAIKAGFLAESIDDVWGAIKEGSITEKDDQFVGVAEAVAAVAKAKPHWVGSEVKPRGTPRLEEKKKTGGDGNREVPKGPRSF
jgi:hypothetical protein